MSQYGDTNPHFWPTQPDHHLQPETVQPWDFQAQPQPHTYPQPHHPDQVQPPHGIQVRPRPPHHTQPPPGPTILPPRGPPEPAHQQPITPPKRHPRVGPPSHPVEVSGYPPRGPPEHAHQPPPTPPKRHPRGGPPSRHPVEVPPERRPRAQQPHQPRPHVSFEQGGPHHQENLMYPRPSRTKPMTWFVAVFCVILWLVIILGGLLVLIIYLLYHPRTPHFEISSATLNAAYLDMGYLLNADLTVLANFTNPNRKVHVDFSYVILQLYFDSHPIANQYIEPFSALNSQSKLANVEMISSQVRLPSQVTQKLVTQMQRNRIMFEVDGIFHARSNFGSLLRYSYWLYGHCTIEMTGPPTGIMIASKCRTKE